ncbi:hypothetical protein ACNPQM_41785 [Streptomyces sp. NPDC056231]|uniref:hypothetical protein n=1 Tax=Streptomyces sp. NPDC056231 TaxID=3345755 RepID=UPI003AAE72B6
MRKPTTLSALAVAATAVTLMAAAPSHAAEAPEHSARQGTVRIQHPADAQVLAGWLGTCYVERTSTRAGGWCDGNGPNWNYRGWVLCSNGKEYVGPWKWAGDRTKSYANCPSGSTSRDGGLDVAYF